MVNKCLYLTKTSLLKKIKSKWFIVVNVLLMLVLAVLFNVDQVISFFGGDFNKITPIYVLDETNYTYEILKATIDTTSSSFDHGNYEINKYEKTKSDLIKEIEINNDIIGVVVNPNQSNVLSITLITNGYLDTIDYQLLTTAFNQAKTTVAKALSDVDATELAKITDPVTIKREYLDENKKSEEESMSMIMTTIFPLVILPFFMLTIFLVQMIGAEINDEKTTRGMEIIIANVSPKAHFYSKILAGNLFVLIQGALLFIYGGLALGIRQLFSHGQTSGLTKVILDMTSNTLGTDFLTKIIVMLPILLLLMILTFIGYSLVAGILASITTNTEDFQQVQTPIMLVLLFGYYLAIMAGTFQGSIFIKIMAYIPFISAILSPSLLVIGQIGILDTLLAILIQLIVNVVLIRYGMPIYREGILNYSSESIIKRIKQIVLKSY